MLQKVSKYASNKPLKDLIEWQGGPRINLKLHWNLYEPCQETFSNGHVRVKEGQMAIAESLLTFVE